MDDLEYLWIIIEEMQVIVQYEVICKNVIENDQFKHHPNI